MSLNFSPSVISNKQFNKTKSSKDGFTIIELMIALAIFSLVSVTLYTTVMSITRTTTAQNAAATAQQNGRTIMGLIVSELRVAGLDPTGLANAGIVQADTTTIQFTTDLNMDGKIGSDQSDQNENITYTFVTGCGLVRIDPVITSDPNFADEIECGGGELIISENNLLDNNNNNTLQFLYFDTMSPDPTQSLTRPVTNLGAIRSVVISFELREAAGLAQSVSRPFTSRVLCRNLGM